MRPLITLLVAITLAAPAQAFTIDSSHQALLDTVQEAGIRVYVDPARCDEKPIMGYYNGRIMGLCAKNTPSVADYHDTIRHESIHLAQRCKSITEDHSAPLAVLSEAAARVGIRQFPGITQVYPTYQWGLEAEAWGGAYYMSAEQVDTVVRKYCSFAF